MQRQRAARRVSVERLRLLEAGVQKPQPYDPREFLHLIHKEYEHDAIGVEYRSGRRSRVGLSRWPLAIRDPVKAGLKTRLYCVAVVGVGRSLHLVRRRLGAEQVRTK